MAIPFFLQLARHLPDAPQPQLLGDVLWFGLGEQGDNLPFGVSALAQIEDGRDDPYFGIACYSALKRESHTIREIAASQNDDVETMALWMLAFLPGQSENVELVRAAWKSENAKVRRIALLALAVMGVEMTPAELQVLQAGLTSGDEKLRSTCALSLATVRLRNEQSPSDAVLEAVCEAEKVYDERMENIFETDGYIEYELFIYNLLDEWQEREPERVEAERVAQ